MFCQRISQLHKIVIYIPNKWITYVLTDFSQAINASSANLLVILRKLWFFFLSDLDFFFWIGLTRVTWLVGLINVGTIQSHGLAWKEKRKEKRKSRNTLYSISKSITCLRVRLGTSYLVEIKNFLLKVLYIKLKVSWNSTLGPINSTKNCNETHE